MPSLSSVKKSKPQVVSGTGNQILSFLVLLKISEPLQCSFLSLTKGGGCFPSLNFWGKGDLCRRLAMLSRCRMSNGEWGTGSCLGVSLEFQSSERVRKLLHWCYSPLLLPHFLGNFKGISTQTYRLQVNRFPISNPMGNQNQDLYE